MASKSIGYLNIVFGADLRGFERAMKKAQKGLKKFGSKMKKIGGNLSRNLTMPLLAVGGASAKMALDFQKSMTKINTLVGVSAGEVEKLKKSVLALSGKTATAPNELAEGLYFLTSAGLNSKDAMEALEQVSKGVASGLGESADLSNVAAAAQNAYGKETMSASKALDIFGGMVKTGMFNASELASVLGTQLGLSASLGISFEEVGAMISTYTKTTGDANAATTGLSGVMMSFAKITPKQEAALKAVGLSAKSLRDMLSKQGLQGTLLEMQKRFKANGIELSEFFSKSQSLKAVLGVLGNQTGTYKDILLELEESVGFVNNAFDETSKTSAFKMEKAMNDLRVAGTMLGQELFPIVDALSKKISALATGFSELDDKGKKSVIMWAGIAAAIGPVLMMIGQISIGIGALIPIVISVTTAIRLMTVAMASNPIGLFAVALGGLTAAFFLHKKEVKETKEEYTNLSKAKKGFLGDIENETAESNRLFTIAKNLNVEGELRKKVIDQINTAYGQYLPNLLTEKSTLKDVEAAYKLVNSALINKIALQNQEKEISREAKKYYNQQVDAVKDLGKAFNLTEAEASVLMKSMLKDGGSWAQYTEEFQTMHDELRKTDEGTAMAARTAVTQYTRANNDLGKRIDWIKGKYAAYITEIVGVNNELNKTPGGGTEEAMPTEAMPTEAMPTLGLQLIPVLSDFKPYGDLTRNEFERISNDIEAQWEESSMTMEEQTAHTMGVMIEKFMEFGNKVKQVMSGIGDVISATNEKEQAQFDIWRESQEEKTDILDEEMEKELERVEVSNMSDEEKAAQKIAIEERYAEKKGEIDAMIDKKEKAMKRKQAIRDKAMAIVSAIISTAEAVAANLKFPPLAALIGALGAIQIATIASTPIPFAQGGLVSGPTLGLIGEGSGTSAFNPEVVSPLDKLMGMMGGGSVDVHGRIKGENIVLVSDKAEISRERFI
jgi:TP901 family phage tail tape measure protein